MYLPDSSVWIEYLRPNGAAAVRERVRGIIEREEAACCAIVVVEVLRGAKCEKDYSALDVALRALPQLPLDDRAIERAARWGFVLGRKGVTVPTTDLLIASAAHGRAVLLHRDGDFKRIAEVGGVKEEMLCG